MNKDELKGWATVAALIVGSFLIFVASLAAIVAFYGAIFGGIAGAAYYVFKLIAGAL